MLKASVAHKPTDRVIASTPITPGHACFTVEKVRLPWTARLDAYGHSFVGERVRSWHPNDGLMVWSIMMHHGEGFDSQHDEYED